MQGRLLTAETIDDPIVSRDFANELSPRQHLHRRRRRSSDARNGGPDSRSHREDDDDDEEQIEAVHSPASGSRGKRTERKRTLSIPQTVSFRDDGEAKQQRQRARRRANGSGRQSDVDSDGDDDDLSDDDRSTAYTDDDDDVDARTEASTDVDDDGQSALTSDLDDVAMTADQEEELQVRSGFFVPGFLRRMHERRLQQKREARREAKEAERNKRDGSAVEYSRDGELIRRVYRRMPVFSGTIAPFAIMLEIPGFTSKWYVRITPDGQPNVYRSNPAILDVGLALSLASAIVANIAILGRFSERIRPRKATLIAVICFIIHDALNIAALIAFGVVHAVDDGFTYSEAYWMTTASTGASLCCTVTLMLDYFRTKDFQNAGSGLTQKQSQLVLAIMAFLSYISISALIFALIIPLPFLDAMYFSVETLATVGLGDITPKSTGARVALFFIAPGGIILLAVMVAVARQTILEEFEDAYKRRRQMYKQRMAERHEERREHRRMRSQVRNSLRPTRKAAERGSAMVVGQSEDDMSLKRQDTLGSIASGPLSRTWTYMGVGDASEEQPITKHRWWHTINLAQGFSRSAPQESTSTAQKSMGTSHPALSASPEMEKNLSLTADTDAGTGERADESVNQPPRTDRSASTATQMQHYETVLLAQRRDIERKFEQYRKDLAKAQRNEFWLKLGISAFLFACFWIVGAALFMAIEDFTFFQSFYFIFVVFTSIGYGDFAPTKSSGRALFIVWALFGVGTLTVLFSVVSDAWSNIIQQRKLAKGSKFKKPPSKMKRRLSRVVDRVLPAKVPQREKEQQEAEEATHEESTGKANGAGAEGSVRRDSPTSTTGILLDPTPPANQTGDEKTGSAQGSGGSSNKSSSNEESSAPENKGATSASADISELHLELTHTAMSFHRNAVGFLEMMRGNLMQQIHQVPEILDFMRTMGEAEHPGKIRDEDRTRIMNIAQQTQEMPVVRGLEEWMLIHDFEANLHTLIHKSTAFLDEVRKKDDRLQNAQDEVHRLRELLPSEDAASKSAAATKDDEEEGEKDVER